MMNPFHLLTLLLSLTSLSTSALAQLCSPIQPATNVPAQFNLNTQFYKKYLPGPGGLPIVGSAVVKDEAMYRAQAALYKLAETMDIAIFRSMVGFRIRNSIMAETEVTTDIPEHSDLTPKDYWDQRSRGLGATESRPSVSGGEENLLCTPADRYAGECILLHELSHSIQMFGANFVYPGFQSRLDQAYADARSKGLWSNTYAAENPFEYWAEGAQGYFNCNARSIPSNGIHGEIYNKEQLRFYDPTLFGLLDEVFKGASYVYSCDPKPACANVTTTTSEPTASTSATSTLTTGAVTSTIVPTGSITSTISGGDGGDGGSGGSGGDGGSGGGGITQTSTTPNGPSTSSINIITSGGVASKSTFTLVMGGLVVALLF